LLLVAPRPSLNLLLCMPFWPLIDAAANCIKSGRVDVNLYPRHIKVSRRVSVKISANSPLMHCLVIETNKLRRLSGNWPRIKPSFTSLDVSVLTTRVSNLYLTRYFSLARIVLLRFLQCALTAALHKLLAFALCFICYKLIPCCFLNL
jgi:hypothetical protein